MDEDRMGALVETFYARVREDPMLGPVFNDAVDDWPHHMVTLKAFWSSVMNTTGRYKGSPMRAHMAHAGRITPEMFERWLTLWRATAAEVMPAEEAAAMVAKAERIAESLQLGLFFRMPGARAGG